MSETLVMDTAARERGVTPEYREAIRARGRSFRRGPVGCAEPRLFTPPLRPLTPATSLGFEVIEFARELLGVELYPWQKVLLIRALELREDGETYRFRRIIVLVGRQNGKTTLASVLAAWWLFVDSKRHPERVPPVKFKIVGVAQNLDIAREPWNAVKSWCDPDPDTDAADELAIEGLQGATEKVIDTNGKEGIYTLDRPHYEIRAAASARGKPTARIIFDEVREQKTWAAWNATAHATKSFFNAQLWGISNAGDLSAVVLAQLRDGLLKAVDEWQQYVESGVRTLEEFANGRDMTSAIFEWSAPPGCPVDDIEGILQANPSIGHGEMTVEAVLADKDTPDYRTEALCQWVTSRVQPFLDGERWGDLLDEASEIAPLSRMVLGVDVSSDRKRTAVAIVGYREDGLMHGEVIAYRAHMLWAVKWIVATAERWGITQVALQPRGSGASELRQPLIDAGLDVVDVGGSALGASAGQMSDRVRDGRIRHRGQPALDMAVSGTVVRALSGGDMKVWDRDKSAVDASPLVALANAAYALESTPAPAEFRSAYEDEGLLVM